MNGTFCKWQLFQTPPGFAMTNSSLESYDEIKRLYTDRKTFAIQPLLPILASSLTYEAVKEHKSYNSTIAKASQISKARWLLNSVYCVLTLKSSKLIAGKRLVTYSYSYKSVNKYEIEVSEECKCYECCCCNCSYFLDKGMCVHLLACLIKEKISFPGLEVAKAKFISKQKKGRQRTRNRCNSNIFICNM